MDGEEKSCICCHTCEKAQAIIDAADKEIQSLREKSRKATLDIVNCETIHCEQKYAFTIFESDSEDEMEESTEEDTEETEEFDY